MPLSYALNAAQLLDQCLAEVHEILQYTEGASASRWQRDPGEPRRGRGRGRELGRSWWKMVLTATTTISTTDMACFYDCQEALVQAEAHLIRYLQQLRQHQSIRSAWGDLSEKEEQEEDEEKDNNHHDHSYTVASSSSSSRLQPWIRLLKAQARHRHRCLPHSESTAECASRYTRINAGRFQQSAPRGISMNTYTRGRSPWSSSPYNCWITNGMTTGQQQQQQPLQSSPAAAVLVGTAAATDALLFRLTVFLNLLTVRIDDARLVLTGQRKQQQSHSSSLSSSFQRHNSRNTTNSMSPLLTATTITHNTNNNISISRASNKQHDEINTPMSNGLGTAVVVIVLGSFGFWWQTRADHMECSKRQSHFLDHISGWCRLPWLYPCKQNSIGGTTFLLVHPTVTAAVRFLTQTTLCVWVTRHATHQLSHAWMARKIIHSTAQLDHWNEQWNTATTTTTTTRRMQPSSTTIIHSGSRRRDQEQQPSQPSSSWHDEQDTPHHKEEFVQDDHDQRHEHHTTDQSFGHRKWAYRSAVPKTSMWLSQGELRFFMLKRAMEVFYASVGTALQVKQMSAGAVAKNDDNQEYDDLNPPISGMHHDGAPHRNTNANSIDWQVTLITAAVSFFYTLTGASHQARQVTSDQLAARALIQNAWGMVSWPALKLLSLQASRLIKGAAVADRIEICGVSCFVLSRDPAPELAAAIKRFHRKHGERSGSAGSTRFHQAPPIRRLTTILEHDEAATITEESHAAVLSDARRTSRDQPFARSNDTRYRLRDVILHLTGGGFFAHTIASDLPFLLDWSASTGAVVICPEYALLPNHTFPTALLQVEAILDALLGGTTTSSSLGFEVHQVILTGESVGGNLAASLCVKLIHSNMDAWCTLNAGGSNSSNPSRCWSAGSQPGQETTIVDGGEEPYGTDSNYNKNRRRLPCALMLSCPVLDLSLDIDTHNNVLHQQEEDPVLPSGLVTAISDAYLPSRLDISKKDPLVSPLYAMDDVLRYFPPTLMFASSNDLMMDDTVHFNARLCSVGVESTIRAATNVPHAYLGLGMAGFPEAQQVQQECQDWMLLQLSRVETTYMPSMS